MSKLAYYFYLRGVIPVSDRGVTPILSNVREARRPFKGPQKPEKFLQSYNFSIKLPKNTENIKHFV